MKGLLAHVRLVWWCVQLEADPNGMINYEDYINMMMN